MSHPSNRNEQSVSEIPLVHWLDLETDREKYLDEIRYASLNVGFWCSPTLQA